MIFFTHVFTNSINFMLKDELYTIQNCPDSFVPNMFAGLYINNDA